MRNRVPRDPGQDDMLVAGLAQDKGFQALTDRWNEYRRRILDTLAADYFAPNALGKPIDQRRVDFYRGFIAGVDWLVKNPYAKETEVLRYLEEASNGRDRARTG